MSYKCCDTKRFGIGNLEGKCRASVRKRFENWRCPSILPIDHWFCRRGLHVRNVLLSIRLMSIVHRGCNVMRFPESLVISRKLTIPPLNFCAIVTEGIHFSGKCPSLFILSLHFLFISHYQSKFENTKLYKFTYVYISYHAYLHLSYVSSRSRFRYLHINILCKEGISLRCPPGIFHE